MTITVLPLFYLLIIATAFSITPQDQHTCGGNCLSESCEACVCGEKQNQVNITAICDQSFWSSTCCQCVLRILSKGNSNAVSMSDNKIRVGLFQINSFEWITYNGGRPPCDPSSNLNCAFQIYKRDGNIWKRYWGDAATKCGCR